MQVRGQSPHEFRRLCDAVHYIDAEECSYPICVHLLSRSAFIRVPKSGPEFATADKRKWETRMDADGFKEFSSLHSSTAFPMHLIADAPQEFALWPLLRKRPAWKPALHGQNRRLLRIWRVGFHPDRKRGGQTENSWNGRWAGNAGFSRPSCSPATQGRWVQS